MIYIIYNKSVILIINRCYGNYYNHENKAKIIKEKSIIIIIIRLSKELWFYGSSKKFGKLFIKFDIDLSLLEKEFLVEIERIQW